MKTGIFHRFLITALLVGVFNAIVFLVPFDRHDAFWTSYVVAMIAFGLAWLVTEWSMGLMKGARSQFYGFPIAKIGWLYLGVQLVLSFFFMIFGENIESWIIYLAFILVAAAAALGLVAVDTARNEVLRQEKKTVTDTFNIRNFSSRVIAMASKCKNDATRMEIAKLADNLRYSDPVSSEGTKEAERMLEMCLNDLEVALDNGNEQGIVTYCQKANEFLTDRNRICKLEKQNNN